MDPKLKAIIAHIGIPGWIIIIIINNVGQGDRDEMSGFYLRQTLGIYITGMVGTLIPVVNIFIWIFVFIGWLLSLISAIQGETRETPLVGNYFQEWFKGIA